MPWAAPRFGRPKAARAAWARPKGQPDRRLRGRPGMRLRALVLSEEPYCRACLAAGREVASDEVDHIVPLSDRRWAGPGAGDPNARGNLQALCEPCHKAKSLAERIAGRRR